MDESMAIVDEEKTMLRIRLSNLEDTITHLQYIKAKTEATHKQEVATLQDRINSRLVVLFSTSLHYQYLLFQSWNAH